MSEYNESKYRAKWEKEHKDRIILLVPKGTKEQIKAKALEAGYQSMNGYINMLIQKEIYKMSSKEAVNN